MWVGLVVAGVAGVPALSHAPIWHQSHIPSIDAAVVVVVGAGGWTVVPQWRLLTVRHGWSVLGGQWLGRIVCHLLLLHPSQGHACSLGGRRPTGDTAEEGCQPERPLASPAAVAVAGGSQPLWNLEGRRGCGRPDRWGVPRHGSIGPAIGA